MVEFQYLKSQTSGCDFAIICRELLMRVTTLLISCIIARVVSRLVSLIFLMSASTAGVSYVFNVRYPFCDDVPCHDVPCLDIPCVMYHVMMRHGMMYHAIVHHVMMHHVMMCCVIMSVCFFAPDILLIDVSLTFNKKMSTKNARQDSTGKKKVIKDNAIRGGLT